MKEEDARKKWCPFVRIVGPGSGMVTAVNRVKFTTVMEPAMCIGSDCMMWAESPYTEDKGDCGLKTRGFIEVETVR